ncbi:peptidoglycan D,D-transpeptidase FtsI family protein [Tomitella cavernea]|uniref:peptidoglycan D,D-transpeptidase FtsI family protein n=1 Tax=Tomitella cavernea TaxID=1387982 RepID=UPI001906CA75|nr:penicillin-binding protein 2 [Tomitella cavernea]
MNTPMRRVAMLVMTMVVVLLAGVTYLQVFKADELRADPRNQRVLVDEYSRQRGQISADGQVLAASVESGDRFKFLRVYPANPHAPTSPEANAPVTGFYSLNYASSGLEKAEDQILSGSDDRLFGNRLFDLVSGRNPRGGNVETTINPVLQQVAYDQLASQDLTGSVVALDPRTGAILAMVSAPSYDPNLLAGHDGAEVAANWKRLHTDPRSPMLNRAISQTYPPGSTFKVVTSAAALENGATINDPLTAAAGLTLPGTNTVLHNYADERCGPGDTVPMIEAFARSCNAAFAQLGIKYGADALRDTAEDFGIGPDTPSIPLPVADSTVGTIPDAAALGQSSIGQRDVALTPLQNAVIAATVANGGVRMQPYLVEELEGPDLKTLSTTSPTSPGQAIPPDVADELTQMMIASEQNTTGAGSVPGVQIASKTGTAEHGSTPKQTPPHGWYIAFAPAQNPVIAVAVIVEDGGNAGLAATGGKIASPIGRAVIEAAVQGGQ